MLGLLDTRAGFVAAATLVLLGSFFLRTWRLWPYDLWVDEAISFSIANLTPIDIIGYTAANISEHPPGYYFALHFWMELAGTSEFALRFFSVLGGMLYLALLIMLVRRWFGNRLALLVGVLFCVQPLAVTLSRDTRMYTWYGTAVLLMVFLFDRALRRGRSRNWMLFALAALIAITFNYMSVFVLLALALFTAINWRTLRRSLVPFTLILAVLVGAPLVWIAVSPGPRGSMAILFDALKVPWSPARLFWLYFGWPLSGAADERQTLGLWLLAGLRWVLAVVGIVWMATPRRWPRRTLQWLLGLLIVVPPLLASVVFVLIKQRYFFSTLGLFVIAIALGIVAFWRRSRPLGAGLAVVLAAGLLFMDGRASFPQLAGEWHPFRAPVEHILARAQQGEPIVYTYVWERFQDEYYNAGRQPVAFVPPHEAPVTQAEAEASALEALAPTGSAWLVVYPSNLHPEIVEHGFNSVAYPGEKTWFPGSRAVVRYFADRPMTEQAGGMVWGDRFKLVRWWSSGHQVAAGDALRLSFEWQDVGAEESRPGQDKPADLIEISLVGADGQTWASRIGAPCNALCPVSGWDGQTVQDRQALYIPLDIPPGRYAVQIRWLTASGRPLLVGMPDDASREAFVTLQELEVVEPTDGVISEAPLSQALGLQTTDGNLTLVSLDRPAGAVRPGISLVVPMQWRAQGPLADLEARLRLSRQGQDTVLVAPLAPEWYGSARWTPGRLVRTQPSFAIPGTLGPGDYAMTLEVGPAGSAATSLAAPAGGLTVQDRERSFDLPRIGEPVAVDWEEGIHLARMAAPAEVQAGDAMTVTLVWQAGRPTGGNWKVFMHLVDADGEVQGQGDGYPDGGSALTPTWVAGEVVVDEHRIDLRRDLPPGDYRLRIGFYDEMTNERLPLAPGVDTYVWPQAVVVRRP